MSETQKTSCPVCRRAKPFEHLRQLRSASLTKAINAMVPIDIQMTSSQGICAECWYSIMAGVVLKAHECSRGNML
jgi:hypothetical protein